MTGLVSVRTKLQASLRDQVVIVVLGSIGNRRNPVVVGIAYASFTAPDSSELGYVSQIEHVQPCPPCCALAVRARRNVLRCSISDILSELWCVTNHRCQGALSRPSYGWRDHAFRIRGNRAGMIAGSAGRRPPAGWLAGRGVGAVRAPSAHACGTDTGGRDR